MPTTQEEKPVKPRSRNRKTDRRNQKAEAKAQSTSVHANVEAEPVSAVIAPIEEAAVDLATVDATPADSTLADVTLADAALDVTPADVTLADAAPADIALADIAPAPVAMEDTFDAALNGEVLPPEVRQPATQAAGLLAIAQAYGDCTRKSWQLSRFLVERLIVVRSFDEAIEIQGEFAKQACANFLGQSERICVLYGEWALGLFRPYERLATEWTRAGR